jgi:hypothetical protein
LVFYKILKINESSDGKNNHYEKLGNQWSDGVKLSNLEFLSRLSVCKEKVNSLLLELGCNEMKLLNKEEFYELMRKIEFSQKYEKNEFRKESFILNFEFTQNENNNEYVFLNFIIISVFFYIE